MGHLVSAETSTHDRTGLGAVQPAAAAIANLAGQAYVGNMQEGDAGVAETIALMRSLVISGDQRPGHVGEGARHDPYIRAYAGQIVAPMDPRDQVGHAAAIFDWVRDNIRFVRDPNKTELVQNPRWTLIFGFGDCDDMTALLATMVESVGIPANFQTVALEDSTYDHVFANALIGGRAFPMDRARMNPTFGVTNGGIIRSQTWPIDTEAGGGDTIPAAQLAGGKHYAANRRRPLLNGGFASLGQDSSSDFYDPSTNTTVTTDSSGQVVTFSGLPSDGSAVYDAATGVQYTQAQLQQLANQTGDVTAAAISAASPTTTPGLTAPQIAQLINAGGTASASIIKAINTPGNPYYNPLSPYFGYTGVGAGSTNLFGIPGLSSNMLLLALGAALLLSSRK